MTLIVTILTALLAGVSGVLQYLEKIDEANQKAKDAIESERKQREISEVQKQLIKKSEELGDKTNELLALNIKLRKNNELVIKLQNEQKYETRRLLSPIADKFRASFQIWFYNESFCKSLDYELTTNPESKFLSLYPLQLSNVKNIKINNTIEDLINRINRSEIQFAFFRANINYRPLDLLGELDLHDVSFVTGSGNYNFKDENLSAYKYNFWVTYNKGDGFLRLNISNLPLKIMLQHPSIISLKDLNNMDVNIGAIDNISYKSRLNSKAIVNPEKIEVKWISLLCGNKLVGNLMDPVFDTTSKKYFVSNFQVSK